MPVYNNMTFACLTPEHHERTCNYWVTVMNNGISHTAFRTQASFLAWLEMLGLEIDVDLPPVGTHAFGKIRGRYIVHYHSDGHKFYDIIGRRVLVLNNGTFYNGKMTGRRGSRTLHVPHFDGREPYIVDYRRASDLIDVGIYTLRR